MARTVLSESMKQNQVRSKTGSSKGNVIASILSATKASSSSTQSVPPKRLARTAQKLDENQPEKKTLKSSNDDQKSKVKPKKGGGDGLKSKYIRMIAECIFKLKQKNGSSRQGDYSGVRLKLINVQVGVQGWVENDSAKSKNGCVLVIDNFRS